MSRKPQIFTRSDDQMVPVDMGTLDMLAQEEEGELLVREFIQAKLLERMGPVESDVQSLKAFLDEYRSLSKRNPIGMPGDRYWYMGEIDGKYCLVITNIRIDERRGSIQFGSIQTVPPDVCEGQGFASKIMNQVTALADKHGVALRLDVHPFAQESMVDEDLDAWYRRAGFEAGDPNYESILVRQPQLTEKKLRGKGKDKRLLYHINRHHPAKPQPKMTYLQDWDNDKIGRDGQEGDFVNIPGTDNWQRHWLDSPVKSGVFLTPNPMDIAMNHGRSGHVYAYRVPQWVIAKSGGIHRYDKGSEVLIPEDVWEDAGKEIEFLGKSMEEKELWDKVDSGLYGRGHNRPANKPSWLSDEEMKRWRADQDKFNLPGLRATKHPGDVIKLLTPEERKKAIEALEAKKEYEDPRQIEKGPRDKKGIVVPPFTSGLDKKDQELLALLKKPLKEGLLRETVRGFLNEAIEFREVDSPLTYSRYGNVKRIAYCDITVTDPPEQRDAYFKEWENWRKFSKGGKRLKKPVLEEIVPGVSDVCIIGFLDYHSQGTYDDGKNTHWYIDYMKTRGDTQGTGVASKLMDHWYQTVPQPGDNVNFGKMMRKEIGHLKDKMIDKYPDIKTRGAMYY